MSRHLTPAERHSPPVVQAPAGLGAPYSISKGPFANRIYCRLLAVFFVLGFPGKTAPWPWSANPVVVNPRWRAWSP